MLKFFKVRDKRVLTWNEKCNFSKTLLNIYQLWFKEKYVFNIKCLNKRYLKNINK